jgi:hypothetical protein
MEDVNHPARETIVSQACLWEHSCEAILAGSVPEVPEGSARWL